MFNLEQLKQKSEELLKKAQEATKKIAESELAHKLGDKSKEIGSSIANASLSSIGKSVSEMGKVVTDEVGKKSAEAKAELDKFVNGLSVENFKAFVDEGVFKIKKDTKEFTVDTMKLLKSERFKKLSGSKFKMALLIGAAMINPIAIPVYIAGSYIIESNNIRKEQKLDEAKAKMEQIKKDGGK